MDKKKKISLAVFGVGILTLIAGIVVMLIGLLSVPAKRDADFLVEVGTFVREDAPSVIWDFTEIGKGTLTTNNHENDYNFVWKIEDDKLVIETDWLYDLNDEYNLKVNQEDKTLTLNDELVFRAASSDSEENML